MWDSGPIIKSFVSSNYKVVRPARYTPATILSQNSLSRFPFDLEPYRLDRITPHASTWHPPYTSSSLSHSTALTLNGAVSPPPAFLLPLHLPELHLPPSNTLLHLRAWCYAGPKRWPSPKLGFQSEHLGEQCSSHPDLGGASPPSLKSSSPLSGQVQRKDECCPMDGTASRSYPSPPSACSPRGSE